MEWIIIEKVIAYEAKGASVEKLVDVVGGTVMEGGSIRSGEVLTVITSPGCWGPMITPSIRSGHEVSAPIFVEGAEEGDSVALFIEKIDVLSEFAASGTAHKNPDNFGKDPTIHAKCPHCSEYYPETTVVGIGDEAIRCKKCGNPIIPQTFESGYTVTCDAENKLAVSVDKEAAKKIAAASAEGRTYLPAASHQHLATILARADVDQMVLRFRPMVGNIGCAPKYEIPSAKNSGDLIKSLNASGLYETVSAADITDGHMDIANVGEGCTVISPVLVKGAGVYVGDVHLTQGAGELAGHTLDVSARVRIRVVLLKGLKLEGPLLLPKESELNTRFVPLSEEEYDKAAKLRGKHCTEPLAKSWPIQIVGTGNGINEAIDNALMRAANLLDITFDEARNRATVTGCVEIGRYTGSVFLTIMTPESLLAKRGLLDMVKEHYTQK